MVEKVDVGLYRDNRLRYNDISRQMGCTPSRAKPFLKAASYPSRNVRCADIAVV